MTPARQPQIFKAIKIEKPYEATALTDGWLCIKYLDGGEESISTFADISKGDVVTYSRPHTSPPAPNLTDDQLEFVIKCERAEAAKAERERFPTADELEVLALALIKIHIFQPDFCNDWNLEKTDALLKKIEKCTESLRGAQEEQE